jgi:S1-C subfamily serine protease
MLKNIFKIFGVFILGVLGGIWGSQILQPYLLEQFFFYKYGLPSPPIYINKTEKIVIQENVALKNAVEKIEKAVIGVKTITKKGKILEGSGLILTSDGLVITLAHLVPKGGDFNFYFDGKEVKYQILKRDLKENLALIKFEENGLPTAGFGNLEKLKLGERAFLVGVIFAPVRDGVSNGVKEEARKFTNEGIVKYFEENSIETNISEKRASGSILFDIEGNILGLNYLDQEGRVMTIPVSKLRKFANL